MALRAWILGGRGDLLSDGDVDEERFDCRAAQLIRVPLVMEEAVAFNPCDVGFLRADRVMLEPYGLTNLVKKFFRGFLHH
jgi:hypothetical protein